MSGKSPPTFVVSPEDHGGVAVIVSTLLMTWTILCFLIRIYTRQNGPRMFGADDWLCLVATVIGVIQTIVICVAVEKGFGKSERLISDVHLYTVQGYTYAVVLLCILTIYITKISMVFFHIRITPRKEHKKIAYGLLGLLGVVGVVSFIVEAARCGGSEPWVLIGRSSACSDYTAGWTAIAVLDIVMEVFVFAMPVYILWDVQMALKNKLVICSAFALRLPVIIAAALHLYYVRRYMDAARPLVAAITPYAVLQVEVHYATMSSTFPCLGPFMKNLNTRMGTMGVEEANAYALESVNDKSGTHGSRNRSQANGDVIMMSGHDTGYSFRMQKSTRDTQHSRTRGSDDSGRMIIHKTTDTTVEYDK